MSTIATAAPVAVQSRVVNRGANPFAPIIKQQNINVTPAPNSNVYESVQVRGDRVFQNPKVQAALANMKKRLNGNTYNQSHFGEILNIPFGLLDINIDIQRDEEPDHIADDILDRYDPRICMPVMCTKLDNGRYSAWEGQQTSLAFYVMYKAGIIDENTLIQVKAFDEDLQVPGTSIQGEAVGNLGFRVINGKGRKSIDAYTLHRSRVAGVRVYGSQFREDEQSNKIQLVLQNNNMFPAKTSDAANNKATPGMVTYIHGLNMIANHDSDQKVFDECIEDLDWALHWHNTYYPGEKGVDGGFILTFGRLAEAARRSKPAIKLDYNVELDLYNLFRAKYGSPKGFHRECKDRLRQFQRSNDLPESWTDNCLLPILILDYYSWGGKYALPQVPGLKTYRGI
jgi:hypothetical protein